MAFAAASPTIVVTPSSAMVDTSVELTGTGFPAAKRIEIKECSKTFWIVPENPCATTNVIRVRTNTNGAFTHKLKVRACPVTTGTPGFSQTCYVGDPAPQGIDTVSLSGSAEMTVTGP